MKTGRKNKQSREISNTNSMSLRDIHLKISYNSGEDNLVGEFYIPCFRNSTTYERAVGFFTAEILTAISCGLTEFVSNNGTMKLICSPRLSEDDVKAIEKGYKERASVVCNALFQEIDRIPEGIVDDSLNFLSWLISTYQRYFIQIDPPISEWYHLSMSHEGVVIKGEIAQLKAKAQELEKWKALSFQKLTAKIGASDEKSIYNPMLCSAVAVIGVCRVL